MAQYTRKLIKNAAYSYAVTIPSEIVQKYGWREKQKMTITDFGGGKVVVRDHKRR